MLKALNGKLKSIYGYENMISLVYGVTESMHPMNAKKRYVVELTRIKVCANILRTFKRRHAICWSGNIFGVVG